ncbi:MAG: TonB-dependent receptor [Candidatus Sphingomonas phytovorans]|nr:TonB-dependent receptor [Sphingomonas sp.]WEK02293.1 MAG: TonB-dependent receptor [Sphingomonas sp.]
MPIQFSRGNLLRKRRLLLGAAFVVGIGWTTVAVAQSEPPQEPGTLAVEDIVVTAQRRAERLQDVPIAVTAITSSALETRGVTTSSDLAQTVSGLSITNNSGYVQPRLRGVGNNVIGLGYEGGVATYIDGVYIGSAPASLLSLSNIERVEVLKGPQGTLFGRNATGGLIQVVTREPSRQSGGQVSLGYGNYGTISADAYVTGGVTDSLAVDLAGHASAMKDGFGHNVRNGQDVYKTDRDVALRSSLLYDKGSTRIRISADYSELAGSLFTALRPAPGAQVYLPIAPLPHRWDVDNDFQPYYAFRGWGVAGTVNQDVGGVRITSITAYRRSRMIFDQDTDATGTPGLNIRLTQTDKQFSQELQLSSTPGSPISWVVGAYYFHATGITDPTTLDFYGPVRPVIPGFGVVTNNVNNATTKTEAFAGFAQATVPIARRTNLTLGFRYSTERRSLDSDLTTVISAPFVPFPITNQAVSSQSKRFSDPTWRVSLDHHFSDDVMVYASYNRGFKSGGYNAALATQAPYSPERLDAYEVGLKSSLLDRRVRLNASAFFYDYKDIQVGGFALGQIYYYNGARAHIWGAELELVARVTSALRLSGGLTILDDKFTAFPNAIYFVGFNQVTTRDAKGNRLPQTARFTGNVTADYEIPVSIGKINLSATYSYNSGYYTEVDNNLYQPRFGLLNGGVGLKLEDGLGIRGWVRNLTNAKVTNSMNTTNIGATTNYQPPRTYGVTVSASF